MSTVLPAQEVWNSEEKKEKSSHFEGLRWVRGTEPQLNHKNQANNNTEVMVL
jgi:hypothetical protein